MSIAVVLAVRYLLVVLFFPFSALDKIIGFRGAVGQAAEAVGKGGFAVGLVLAGLAVEVFMYCGVTALLWKRWWQPGDFWRAGDSKARNLFWDFLKNFSLAGGFLLLAFGLHAGDLAAFLSDPFGSSHPYGQGAS